MKLSVQQCLQLIKTPANVQFLQLAKKQEERLVMHVEPILEANNANGAVQDFLAWVKSFLPDNKFNRFKQLLQFPLETVELTDSIFDELSKFHDTPDNYTRFQFSNPSLERDFLGYLGTDLNDENFWKEKGFEALKTGINSFLIVDLPTEQTTPRPKPYFYFLPVAAVHDVDINQQSGAVEYIIFNQGDGSKIVIDDLAYRKFIKPNESSEYQLAQNGEAFHSTYQSSVDEQGNLVWGELVDGLGYAPVCSFYEHSIKGSKRINKRGPLTKSLSKLDWLLFWKVSKKYLDLYGSWPILVRYKQDCSYRDEQGNECREGFVNYDEFDSVNQRSIPRQKECPVCAKRGLLGPGTDFTIDPPGDSTDADLMKNDPIRFIEPTNDKLEYGVSELERLEREIKKNSLGFIPNEASKEAMNETQIRGQLEARKAVLNRIREQFDATRKFALETVARLRYGRYFLSATVFGGEEYFLQTPDDIASQYATAKKNGLPSYEVVKIRESYGKTKYKGNPSEQQRALILSHLEPYPDFTLAELRNLGFDAMDGEGFMIKANFISFINRFERENTNIVEFGSLIDFDKKIQIIQGKLAEYAGEKLSKIPKSEEKPV